MNEFVFMHGTHCVICNEKLTPHLGFQAKNPKERKLLYELITKKLKFFCKKHFEEYETKAMFVTGDDVTLTIIGDE